jgi:hypothetical protein
MKYLKITMTRGSAGEAAMKYPAPYDPQEVDRNKQGPIVYEGAFQYGEATEECLVYLNNAVANAYDAASADMAVITEAEADAWLAANRLLAKTPEESVAPDRIAAIKLKYDLGETLSEEDRRALDPDDPIPGINRRKKTARGIFGA